MKPLKSSISITLDEDVLEEITSLAEYDARSISAYINMVLKEHIDAHRALLDTIRS